MRRKHLIYGASLMVLVVAFAVISSYLLFVPRVSIERVRADIDMNVPVGTSKENAKEWLTSQSHIHYHGMIADKRTGSIEGISGYIADTGPRWETPERIEIVFYLENDSVSHVEVERRSTPFVFPSP